MIQYKAEIAQWIIRVFTGIIFFFQGYDKLFRVRIEGVINTFLDQAEQHHIHKPWVTALAWYTSIIEFFGGIALITGLFTTYSLYLLGIDLLLVAAAFSILQPVWDMKHVFPRLLLISVLLLLPEELNKLSIDFLLK